MKKNIHLPKFKNKKAEQQFWKSVDLSKHFSPEDFESAVFPNLKSASRPISLRISELLLFRLKERANELDIPYQSLMKQYIAEGVKQKQK